jgi:PilZ domain
MVAVSAGDRVVLRTAGGQVALRVLRSADLVGAWRLHVLAPAGRAGTVAGVLEVAGQAGGTVRLPARLAIAEDGLVLEAGRAGEPTGTLADPDEGQRRQDVRGELHLPVRVAALDGRGEQALRGGVVGGHTLDVSAGGARLDLPGLRTPPCAGARLYVELTLPGEALAPAVVEVVGSAGGAVQVRFLDLAPADRDRLAGLVFQAERRLLAERRRRFT